MLQKATLQSQRNHLPKEASPQQLQAFLAWHRARFIAAVVHQVLHPSPAVTGELTKEPQPMVRQGPSLRGALLAYTALCSPDRSAAQYGVR